MAKNLIMIACIFLFLIVVGWVWKYRDEKNQLTGPEKEFRNAVIKLLDYLDNFRLSTNSEDYHARVFNATIANKKLLTDIRINPCYSNEKIIFYKTIFDTLYELETVKIRSLHHRRLVCRILHGALLL